MENIFECENNGFHFIMDNYDKVSNEIYKNNFITVIEDKTTNRIKIIVNSELIRVNNLKQLCYIDGNCPVDVVVNSRRFESVNCPEFSKIFNFTYISKWRKFREYIINKFSGLLLLLFLTSCTKEEVITPEVRKIEVTYFAKYQKTCNFYIEYLSEGRIEDTIYSSTFWTKKVQIYDMGENSAETRCRMFSKVIGANQLDSNLILVGAIVNGDTIKKENNNIAAGFN